MVTKSLGSPMLIRKNKSFWPISSTKGNLTPTLGEYCHELEESLTLPNFSKIHSRLNLYNPFDIGLRYQFKIDKCPAINAKDWIKFPLRDLEKMRDVLPIPIPKIPKENMFSLYNLGKIVFLGLF